MALIVSFLPLINYISLLSPTIIALFIVFGSALNQDLKGIIYLCGLLCSLMIGIMLKAGFKGLIPAKAHAACNIFSDGFPNSQFSNPSLDTLSLVFTAAYILMPMVINQNINWTILVGILLITFLNAAFRLNLHCNAPLDIIIGVLVGALCGIGYYTLVNAYGGDKYVFFSKEKSNNVVCKKPSDQKFKCVVYKNGEIINQL